jgi:hypothetical protein
MKKRRRPPANKKAKGLLRGEIRLSNGVFTARIEKMTASYLQIHLICGNGKLVRYTARLMGKSYVVFDENLNAEFMPPYYGRQFATEMELKRLVEEMLATYIMLNA